MNAVVLSVLKVKGRGTWEAGGGLPCWASSGSPFLTLQLKPTVTSAVLDQGSASLSSWHVPGHMWLPAVPKFAVMG